MTAEAEEIKKKNPSVFSITGFALIPFLRWLLKSGTDIAASSEKAEVVIQAAKSANSLGKTVNTVKTVADTAKTVNQVGNTVEVATTVGANTVASGVATKIIATTLALVLGIGGLSYVVKNKNKNDINDDYLNIVTNEQTTKNEVVVANSLADLNLGPEAVKSVTAILGYDVFGINAGEVISESYYTESQTDNKWFKVYWVYYYLLMNEYCEGNELKRNDQFQNEFISKYGEYTDSLYPGKEPCGIPDYDSFSKLYNCLFGKRNVEQEYEKLQKMVMERKEFPAAYGMRPIDIDFDDEKFVSLGNDEYQMEYTITTRHSTGDVMVEANGYAFAYAEPMEVYRYVMSFKLNDESPLGFDVIENSMALIQSYHNVTYVDNNGNQTVVTRDDIEDITIPYSFDTPW